MKIIKISILLTLLFIISPALAVPTLSVQNFDKPINFNKKNIVLIKKGDDVSYRKRDFDDSKWTVTSLPSTWDKQFNDWNGICWYRINLMLPKELPDYSLGILLGIITDADEVYFNGTLIGKSGAIDGQPVSAYDKKRIYEIPTKLLRPGERNTIAVRVRGLFPGENGPYTGDFKIAGFRDLFWDYISREMFDLIFVVVYIVVGFYFALFFIRRRQDKENLFFSLFCLFVSSYLFLRTQAKYLLELDFYIVKKIEYLLLPFLVILFFEFIIFYFRKKYRVLNYTFLAISIIPFFIILFSGSITFWNSINLWIIQPTWLIVAAFGIFIIVTQFRKNNDARLMVYTIFILLAAVINDILVTRDIYQFTRLTGYGFFFFIGSIAIILDNKFVQLHSEVEDLNLNLENKVDEKTEKLLYAMEDMEAAKRETDNILKNVQEGIFLLDKEYSIGANYSSILNKMFEKTDLANANFINIMKNMVNENILNSIRDFLDLSFIGKVPEKRLSLLNPLDDIKVSIPVSFDIQEKHLSFKFNRIIERDENTYLLTTVQDISEEKQLQKKIEETKEKAQKEMQLLFDIIHINPKILSKFVEDAKDEIVNIEKELESSRFSKDLHTLLNSVFRSAHAIKGDAGQLGLEIFAEKAHAFEETIKNLSEKPDLQAVDLVSLLYSLVKVKDPLKEIESLLERLAGYQNLACVDDFTDEEILMDSIIQMVTRSAKREEKDVRIDLKYFKVPILTNEKLSVLKKVAIQIAKNSVSHGIEKPEERKKIGKPEKGTVSLKTEKEKSQYVITIKDDGQGLQLDSIKEKAISLKRYSKEDLDTWPKEKIANLIFDPGMSTQHDVSIDSGRGVGLDIVKTEIHKLGGKITIKFAPGKYTEFRITIPEN